MSLKNKLFGVTTYGFIDQVFSRLLGIIAFVVIIRLLSREDIGIIGLVAGYLVIFNFFSLAPETVLLRDFPKIKSKVNLYISSFMVFSFFRTVVSMSLAGLVAMYLYWQFGSLLVVLVFLASVLFFNMGLFTSIITELFHVDFRQRLIMTINLVMRVFFLGLLLLLYFNPTLLFYVFLSFVSSLIGMTTWYLLLLKYFSFRFCFTREIFQVLRFSISDFAFWQHLNGAITYMIYRVDTAILGFFTTFTVIGDYTIALAVANFFFFVPQILQKSVMVGLSNITDKEDEGLLMGIVMKYSLVLAIAQLIFFVLFGKWIIAILFTAERLDEIYLYALLIVIGVTILNAARPLMPLIATKCSLREGFFEVYLPGGVLAVLGYVVLTYLYGPIGTAIGNIAGYSFFSLLSLVFIWRKYPLKLQFALVTPEEKEMFRGIIQRILHFF
jgi:O-antigen/teichoic acid export membrane protein